MDCGAAGHSLSDGRRTIVYAYVEEEGIRFRVVTSPREDVNWEVTDEWSIIGVRRVGVQLLEPGAGDEVSVIVNIEWSISGEPGESQTTTLFISSDAGSHWDTLATVEVGETASVRDTANYPDGTRSMLRVVVKGDSGFGMVQSAGTFTVNNPGNGAPEVTLKSPTEGDTVQGEVLVEWEAADAEGNPLLITLETSIDEGATWILLVNDEPNSSVYVWDTQTMPNSTHCKLKLFCTDGTVWAEKTSGIFAI